MKNLKWFFLLFLGMYTLVGCEDNIVFNEEEIDSIYEDSTDIITNPPIDSTDIVTDPPVDSTVVVNPVDSSDIVFPTDPIDSSDIVFPIDPLDSSDIIIIPIEPSDSTSVIPGEPADSTGTGG
jgi:hypothetical protein